MRELRFDVDVRVVDLADSELDRHGIDLVTELAVLLGALVDVA